jgi:hypothetical protein
MTVQEDIRKRIHTAISELEEGQIEIDIDLDVIDKMTQYYLDSGYTFVDMEAISSGELYTQYDLLKFTYNTGV